MVEDIGSGIVIVTCTKQWNIWVEYVSPGAIGARCSGMMGGGDNKRDAQLYPGWWSDSSMGIDGIKLRFGDRNSNIQGAVNVTTANGGVSR
jgi:hypothetical protein